jgi:hypothetical protein
MPRGAKYGGGSRKGKPNKTTAQAKELIMKAIDNQSAEFDSVMKMLKTKEPREWAKIMVKLMDFVLPKKLDVTTDGEQLQGPTIKLNVDSKEIILK